MLDLPLKIFPPALLAGTIFYGTATALWLQPLVEERMAVKHLIPQCEASLHKIAQSNADKPNVKREVARSFLGILKELGMDEIPGTKEGIELGQQLFDASDPKRLRQSRIKHNSVCSCAVDSAFEDAGLSMTLFVASARTHTPAAIRKLPSTIQEFAQSPQCGGIANN